MITINQVNQHILEQERKINEEIPSEKTGLINRAKKRIEFLRDCVLYLEKEPREEYLKKQNEQLSELITKIESGFWDWYKRQLPDGRDESQWRTSYYSLMDIKKHKRHLATVRYLLQVD